METTSFSKLLFLFFCFFASCLSSHASVTYDRKAILINGQRRILFSGSIHYPRSTPDMWEDLILKAKEGGLDVVETYVFWNVHEPSPGNYNFEGRYDLVRFVKTIQKAGLYAHLRIGPYVCAEWNFGGFPVWLKYVPGISFRTDNEPFKTAMQGFTEKIVGMMKSERLFEFTEFGGPIHKRPVQDLAFAVARFIIRGGSFVNYYMYHGGTNFGRTAGGPFIATSYDYDAPLDEYGLIRQPKYGHLKELHRAIKMCERALVSTDPIITSLGESQQAHVYTTESGDCAAFLSNYDSKSSARVMFNNMHYNLPPWSVSILPDCRNVVFNTAKVGVQTSQMQMLPTNTQLFSWESFDEDVYSVDDSSAIMAPGLLEQINVTKDASDYLWYITSVDIGSSESFLRGGELPTLIVQSRGHAVHVFINGQLSGSAYGTREYRRFMYTGKVNLRAGINRIALLSVAIGLPNVGEHFESWSTGILGPVALHGLDQGKWDLSGQKWTYQVGLKGEAMDLASPNGISSVAWMQSAIVVQRNQPLTWHKTHFDAPEGDEPLALDMEGMGKGQIWINGQSIGRYWTTFATGNCNDCNYAGSFRPPKCQLGCGQPTQRWYHVPRSWLKPTQNLLVIFEELGGNPSKISLVKRSVSSVCADVSEYHPNIKNWHIESYGKSEEFHPPKVHLHCSPGQTISSIKFASFGTPLGTCGNYEQGACHSPASYAILEKVIDHTLHFTMHYIFFVSYMHHLSEAIIFKRCIGKPRCTVTVSNSNFGQDPCPKVLKRLSVEAVCAPTAANWRG
ncbi:hypothetical protein JHK85_045955 [Glycine max]|nr:hypothetical protein JHK85_045955 [Glycine max]